MASLTASSFSINTHIPSSSLFQSTFKKTIRAPAVKCSESDIFFSNDCRPIMLFDGACNLCNGGVKFVRNNDTKGKIRYEALQSQAGRKLLVRSGRSPDDISSVVLVEKDRSYIKSEAVLRILSYLDLPYPQISSFLYLFPLLLRDVVYDSIANNRYVIFGRSNSCSIN
eukprot:TRINITY_DN14567_c0_g2_i1.p1 TRINITY_DN14567_c0_g2~~TRINITY_DN14567_c0_g2_i1.p1  ORF type:complete len:169 (-),score=20.48 TRINITY_DN14567_c0_g2_i1:135-641(-)